MSRADGDIRPYAPTPAYEQAVNITPLRITPADVFAAAKRIYLTGNRLDMHHLASRLGIARATLYRWAGDRDRLLADVIWSTVDDVLREARSKLVDGASGVERIVTVLNSLLETIANSTALRALLERDGQAGLKLITSPEGGVHGRVVEAISALIQDEAAGTGYRPPATPDTLAESWITVAEHFLYSNFVSEFRPELGKAKEATRLLFREDPE